MARRPWFGHPNRVPCGLHQGTIARSSTGDAELSRLIPCAFPAGGNQLAEGLCYLPAPMPPRIWSASVRRFDAQARVGEI